MAMSETLMIANEKGFFESLSSDHSPSYTLALAAVLSSRLQPQSSEFPESTQINEGPISYSQVSPKISENNCERRKKKPYKELTLEEKVQLIRLAEENAGMSQAAIAERYAIAKSNVCRILQRKREYLRAFESSGYAGSRKRKLKSTDSKEDIFSETKEQPSTNSGSDTLRGHMYTQHRVARMFMCRCCNWAFADKAALQLHLQDKEEGGQSQGSSSVQSTSTRGSLRTGIESHPHPRHLIQSQTSPNTFSPLRPIPINNNTLSPPFGLTLSAQGLPLPSPHSFETFSTNSFPRPTEEIFSRLRERMMLNALLGPQSVLPNPSPWINPSIFINQHNKNPLESEDRVEDETVDIITVENDNSGDENSRPAESENDSSRLKSILGNKGSSTEVNEFLDNDSSSMESLLKGQPNTPSAFHPMLKIESRIERIGEEATVHISPSDSHTSGSTPGGSCNGTHCFECSMFRVRVGDMEQRMRFLEEKRDNFKTELLRVRGNLLTSEALNHVLQKEAISQREENQRLKNITQQLDQQIRNYLSCTTISHETRTLLENLKQFI